MDETVKALYTSDSQSRALPPLEKIAANIPGIIFQFLQQQDGSQRVVYVSSGCRELYEIEPELVQKDFQVLYKLLHPEDVKAFAESVNSSYLTGEPWRWEGRIVTPSGKLKWIQGASRPERQPNGDTIWDGLLMDITDRKLTEEKLRESEARYKAILDAIPDLMFRISRHGEYLDCKDEGANVTIPKAEVLGKRVQDLLPPHVALICQEAIAKTLDTESLQTCEYQLPTPLGMRDYEARLVKSGKDEVLAIVRDITERKQAELAQQSLAQKFAKAFSCSPNPITISTLQEGRYIEVNDSFVQLSGYERSEAIGRTAFELNIWVNESDRTKLLQELQLKGVIRNQEFTFRKKSGELILVQVSAEIIDLDGTPCILAISQDITERKQAELALRESEEKFSKAFRSSPIPITILKLKDGRYVDVNDAFLQITGFRREEVISRTPGELNIYKNPDDGDRIQSLLQQQGFIRNLETEFYTKSGESRVVLFSADIITLGGEACMLCVTNDITERKHAEELLRLSSQRDRLLAQTLVQIRKSLNLDQILQTTVNEVRQFLQTDRVFIAVNDSHVKSRILAESVNPKYPSVLGWETDEAILQELKMLLMNDKVRVVEDITQMVVSPKLAALYQKFQTRATLAVPIMLGKEFFGALIANSCGKPRHWQPMEIDLLQQMSEQLSIAIQQAQLYQKLEQLNTNLEHQVEERTAQLRQKMQELQEIHRVKDVVLHTVSHDLRTSVMGNLMVLQNLLNQGLGTRDWGLGARKRTQGRGDAGNEEDAGTWRHPDKGNVNENFSPTPPLSPRQVLQRREPRSRLRRETLPQRCSQRTGSSPNPPLSSIPVPSSIIERMIEGNDRQLGMIDSLLEIHSSESQGIILHREPVKFNKLTEVILKDVEPMLKQNQASCHKLLPQDLPLVFADPLQLQKVFVNLFTHSLQKNPPGVKLKLSAKVEAEMIRCTIQDNGTPLNKLECDRLFDLYVREPQACCSTEIGLRMYLCKQIIKAHGGEIGVNSNRKQGVTFWFTLPLAIPSKVMSDE
ncbi:MAG: PAS domain S-box protein [Chlorogloeopsis fritschii C42_A2020_084]|uniref:PAS domain S-box protein n=1 Tax=Chlorogloeopsis fritschii TaxID=1124 RepID=UPI0019F9311C|nr:PAS domain S-box protein [Chlorogloeopsis fritschii]MBF2009034.1 PAS domain S-box protein [Chlorogloeopsis fritschii C42_A2020_084]